MSNTSKLILPLIEAAQAQKHITHNEAITALDAIVQLSAINDQINIPPQSPTDGDRYIIPNTNAQGAWAGKENYMCAYQNGTWRFYQPRNGWIAWINNSKKLTVFDQNTWKTLIQIETSEE